MAGKELLLQLGALLAALAQFLRLVPLILFQVLQLAASEHQLGRYRLCIGRDRLLARQLSSVLDLIRTTLWLAEFKRGLLVDRPRRSNSRCSCEDTSSTLILQRFVFLLQGAVPLILKTDLGLELGYLQLNLFQAGAHLAIGFCKLMILLGLGAADLLILLVLT